MIEARQILLREELEMKTHWFRCSWVPLHYIRNRIRDATSRQIRHVYRYSFKDYMKPSVSVACKKSIKIMLSWSHESLLNLNLTLNEKGSIVWINMMHSLSEILHHRTQVYELKKNAAVQRLKGHTKGQFHSQVMN